MSLPSKERSTETLARDLGVSLKDLRLAFKRVQRQLAHLELHADFVAKVALGRAVQIRAKEPSVEGAGARGRGRPPGARNGITLFAGPAEVARLRRELAP